MNPYQKQLDAEAREWYEEAKCRDAESQHSDFMYVVDDRAARTNRLYCFDCPTRLNCLEYAVVMREQFGIWGGTTETQRKNLVRTLRRKLGSEHNLEDLLQRRQVLGALRSYIDEDAPNAKRPYRLRKRADAS